MRWTSKKVVQLEMSLCQLIRLVTYRETHLLFDARTSTQKTRQEVALVVAHEIAHQWFGNLVVSDVYLTD